MDTNAANVKQEDKGNWKCPCNGCKKARKAALQEVYDIIYKDRDIAYNGYIVLGEFLRSEGIGVSKSK